MNDTRTDAERAYDAARLSPVAPEQPRSPLYHELKAWIDEHFEEDECCTDGECPACQAAHAADMAAAQQKVLDVVVATMQGDARSLFSDTIPGTISDVPIDILVGLGITAAIERNLNALGMTREQLSEIMRLAIGPVVNTYLITPARRLGLMWEGQ